MGAEQFDKQDPELTQHELHGEEPPRGPPKRVAFVLVYALLMALVGHALWDLLRPGAHALGSRFVSVLTLGSDYVANQPFASAAMDPTPIPGLLLLVTVTTVPLTVPIMLVFILLGQERFAKYFRAQANATAKHVARRRKLSIDDARKLIRKRWTLFFLPVLFVLSLPSLYGVFTVNQAVLIWRTFHANLTAVATALPDSDLRQLNRRFVSMKTRDEYRAIERDMVAAAKVHGFSLPSELLP